MGEDVHGPLAEALEPEAGREVQFCPIRNLPITRGQRVRTLPGGHLLSRGAGTEALANGFYNAFGQKFPCHDLEYLHPDDKVFICEEDHRAFLNQMSMQYHHYICHELQERKAERKRLRERAAERQARSQATAPASAAISVELSSPPAKTARASDDPYLAGDSTPGPNARSAAAGQATSRSSSAVAGQAAPAGGSASAAEEAVKAAQDPYLASQGDDQAAEPSTNARGSKAVPGEAAAVASTTAVSASAATAAAAGELAERDAPGKARPGPESAAASRDESKETGVEKLGDAKRQPEDAPAGASQQSSSPGKVQEKQQQALQPQPQQQQKPAPRKPPKPMAAMDEDDGQEDDVYADVLGSQAKKARTASSYATAMTSILDDNFDDED